MSGYIGSTPVPQATQHRESFTATAGQTSFATAGYTPQFVDVYLNGVHLSPADVTATNGSDVVLVACLVNDIVDVVSYSPFEVAGATFTGTTAVDVATVGGTLAVTGDYSSTTAGTSNLRLGVNAGNSIASGGNFNVCVGDEAGTVLTLGDHNTLVGFNSGALLLTGGENTLLGDAAGEALDVGIQNIAVGYLALTNDTKGSTSTAIGVAALASQNFTSATNSLNTAVGYEAGTTLTTGLRNVMAGHRAGVLATTPNDLIAIGFEAGGGATMTGNNNICIGTDSGHDLTSGAGNIFIGTEAGDKTDDGDGNVGIGLRALGANCAISNTAIGSAALTACTGSNNTAVGDQAGVSVTSGSDNVFLGHDAGRGQVSTSSNLLYIARSNAAAGNDQVWIHGTDTGTCINGDNATAWAQTSDERIKKNIADSTVGLAKINQVQIRNFEYRTFDELDDDVKALNDGNGLNIISKSGTKTGVIAQEIEAIFPSDVQDLADGTKIVTPSDMNYALIKAVQELSTALDAALARITTLEG